MRLWLRCRAFVHVGLLQRTGVNVGTSYPNQDVGKDGKVYPVPICSAIGLHYFPGEIIASSIASS
jgi:hypothetical protein